MEWSLIQQLLRYYKQIHFLIFLDCCFGAQAARQTSTLNGMLPQNVELVAACAMGVKTVLPGPHSFTSRLQETLRKLLDQSKPAEIQNVVNRLASRGSKLWESPVRYSGLPRAQGTVCLEPLHAPHEISRPDRSFMIVKITLRDDLSQHVVEEFTRWLRDLAPRKVRELTVQQIITMTETAHRYVFDTADSSPTSFHNIQEPGKEEIVSAWQTLKSQLVAFGTRARTTLDEQSSSSIVALVGQDFLDSSLKDLECKAMALNRSIERHVMALPVLYQDPRSLVAAVDNKIMQRMGFLPLLILRLKTLFSKNLNIPEELTSKLNHPRDRPDKFTTIFESNSNSLGSVLIEYKTYRVTKLSSPPNLKSTLFESAKQLSAVLHTKTSPKFCNLECKSWVDQPEQERVALIFYRPAGSSGMISLREIIDSPDRSRRPTLEQRFVIARAIGTSILHWHTAGWVHQGIASYSIIFFWQNDNIDYGKPYLCGFEHSRRSTTASAPKNIADLDLNVYRHPSRQGTPIKSHTKEHDIYSFGVLLLELGLWDLARYCLDEEKGPFSPLRIRDILIEHAQTRLNHYMGTTFQEAACRCLKLDLDIKQDDPVESQQGFAFEDRVLKKLHCLGTEGM